MLHVYPPTCHVGSAMTGSERRRCKLRGFDARERRDLRSNVNSATISNPNTGEMKLAKQTTRSGLEWHGDLGGSVAR